MLKDFLSRCFLEKKVHDLQWKVFLSHRETFMSFECVISFKWERLNAGPVVNAGLVTRTEKQEYMCSSPALDQNFYACKEERPKGTMRLFFLNFLNRNFHFLKIFGLEKVFCELRGSLLSFSFWYRSVAVGQLVLVFFLTFPVFLQDHESICCFRLKTRSWTKYWTWTLCLRNTGID